MQQTIQPQCPFCGKDVAHECAHGGRIGQMMLILWQNRDKLERASRGKLTLHFAGDSVRASLEDQLTP